MKKMLIIGCIQKDIIGILEISPEDFSNGNFDNGIFYPFRVNGWTDNETQNLFFRQWNVDA
jgi:hypothetical protein